MKANPALEEILRQYGPHDKDQADSSLDELFASYSNQGLFQKHDAFAGKLMKRGMQKLVGRLQEKAGELGVPDQAVLAIFNIGNYVREKQPASV